jgi:hypothetical protein
VYVFKEGVVNQIYLDQNKPISNLFLTLNITTFYGALNYLRKLPYGRNLDRRDHLSVIHEKRGTCSTKHALIYKLGCECGASVTLHIAVFMMNNANTPRVFSVLSKFDLSQIPEMHCYLRYRNQIIDITFPNDNLPLELIDEERIEPEFLGDYKVKKHKQFIENWLINSPHISYSMEQIFKIRELCIEQLGKL